MKKNLLPILAIAAVLPTASQAAVNVIQNDVSNNTAWTQPGFSSTPATELYDERSLTINGASGLTIDFIQIVLDTTGTFDDSIGLDIDADGTIDFITGESDATATPGVTGYNPWVDSSPFEFSAIITNTGTTIVASWNGNLLDVGSGSGLPFVGSFTLEDWAGAANIDANGLILNDAFTTNDIRLGSLNNFGISSSNITFDIDTVVLKDDTGTVHVFDPDGDGVSAQAVPEPSSSALLLLGASFGLVRRKRRA